MNKVKRPKLGEYVLVARWGDKDLEDPWHVGWLCEIGEDTRGMFYRVCDREDLKDTASNAYRHCWRITAGEGAARLTSPGNSND